MVQNWHKNVLAYTLKSRVKAIHLFPAITLRHKPDFYEANSKIRLAHSALNRDHKAKEYYRKYIKQEPNNYDSHYFLALSCFLSNRYQENLSAIQESIRINPNNDEALHFRASLYETGALQQNHTTAAKCYEYPH
jgi:tetratricopeptide (TPR) repeat protein